MAEKHKHSRDNSCLSPRERPVSAIFPNPLDPAQVGAKEMKSLLIQTEKKKKHTQMKGPVPSLLPIMHWHISMDTKTKEVEVSSSG